LFLFVYTRPGYPDTETYYGCIKKESFAQEKGETESCEETEGSAQEGCQEKDKA
jgi:hypothetical protein